MCSRRRSGWCLMVLKLIFCDSLNFILSDSFLDDFFGFFDGFLVGFSFWFWSPRAVLVLLFRLLADSPFFPGAVVQLPCHHSYRELFAKYACGNIDHGWLLACPLGWARFAVTDLVGQNVRESSEIYNRSSSGIDKTGWNVNWLVSAWFDGWADQKRTEY